MDKGKRIVISVTNDLNYDQRMQRHAGILVDAGFTVILVGRNKKSSTALSQQAFSQVRLNCFFERGKLFYLEFNFRLLLFLLKTKSAIYLSVDLDTLLPNTLASIVHHSKLVFDSHEYFTEVPELINRTTTKLIWDKIAKTCIPYADVAYTVGEALAIELSLKYTHPFGVIRNVPLLQNLPNNIIKEEKFIVYQGALNKGRALEQLILAMKEVDCKLILIGEGDLSRSLRQLVQTENLTDKVEFTGWIRPTELPEFTQKAWLGYNLLEEESRSYYFSLANKFFDYMHAEIPQLCPPFPEYIGINKQFEVTVFCDAKTTEIAFAIQNLLEDSELYKKLQKNCRLAAKAYNLQLESEKLKRIFEAL